MTADRKTLQALLERVTATDGHDLSLADGIVRALIPADAPDFGKWFAYSHDILGSIDAALALVERVLPGWIWEATGGGGSAPFVRLAKPIGTPSNEARFVANTTPLAIIGATLAALLAQTEEVVA